MSKPFTVEIRNSRKGATAWPTPQPTVTVQSPVFAEPALVPSPEPQPVRRILPALDQQPIADHRRTVRTITKRPVGRPRKPVSAAAMADPEFSCMDIHTTGRQTDPSSIRHHMDTDGAKAIPGPDQVEAVRSVITDVIIEAAVAQTALPQSVRVSRAKGKRLTGDALGRGDRWLRRLPAVVSQKHLLPKRNGRTIASE